MPVGGYPALSPTSGGAPIEGLSVNAQDFNTNQWRGSGQTQPDGSYAIRAVAAGNHRVQAQPSGTSFAAEYYNGTANYGAATPVPVTAGAETSGIDFALEAGVSISGRVTSSFTGVDLPDLWVTAVDYQTGEWRGNAQTQPDGTYTISNLPPGIYKVNVDTNGTEFAFEFYGDTDDFNAAKRVDLTSGGTCRRHRYRFGWLFWRWPVYYERPRGGRNA